MKRYADLSASRDEEFICALAGLSGQEVTRCYGCGCCTAGCPCAFVHDAPPHKVMRLAQLGRRREVLKLASPWLCASCRTCTARCPNGIDVCAVMKAVRTLAERDGRTPATAARAFADSFLASLRRHGRVFETGVAAGFAARARRPLADMDLALPAIFRRKLSLTPHRIKNPAEIARIIGTFEKEGK